jgi:predicted nucleic acid-binding protein
VLVADTSGILAALNANDGAHERVRETLEREVGRIVVPELVLAEVDYLTLKHLGQAAAESFIEDVLAGGWSREPVLDADLRRALEVIRRHADQQVGLVDASIVATAERLRVTRILTLDRRHFSVFRLWNKKAPSILP